MAHVDLTRTPLLLDEGIIRKVRELIGKGIRRFKRIRTPEFVRHCVTNISQNPDKVRQIKRKGTVHGVCHATYRKAADKGKLKQKHPKGVHHTTSAYHRAADRLGEGSSR